MNSRNKTRHGYTLLFAVLTATLVLGVTVFILSVSRKQFALSNISRDSMYSLYAADNGIECIVADPNRLSTDPFMTIRCNGETIDKGDYTQVFDYPSASNPYSDVYKAQFSLGYRYLAGGPPEAVYGCSVITVYTYPMGGVQHFIYQSRGYNLCVHSPGPFDAGTWAPDTSSPRTVERAMQLEYH